MALQTPKLRELEVFRTLLRTGSVTEAGRVLGISQPAISKTLRQLEEKLGLVMFRRLGSRFLPTPEAEELVPLLEAVFGAVGALVNAGRAAREGGGGSVTIAAIPTLATVVVPRAVQHVLAARPGLKVSVQVLGTRLVTEAVAQGTADFGLVHDTIDDPALVMEDLGLAAMGCVVPAGHALARRRSIGVQELARLDYASYPVASPIGDHVGALFASAGVAFAPAMQIGSSTVLCQMTQNCGIPSIVETYALATGWWPGLRVLRIQPQIALRPRLVSGLRRPWSLAAVDMAQAVRLAVAEATTGGVRREA